MAGKEFVFQNSIDDESDIFPELPSVEDINKDILSIATLDYGNLRKINETDSANLARPFVSYIHSGTQYFSDVDKKITINQETALPEQTNEKSVENFAILMTNIEKACDLLDCCQTEILNSKAPLECEFDSYSYEIPVENQSLQSDICDVDKLVVNNIQGFNETLDEICSIPELNVTEIEASLKGCLEESSKYPSRDINKKSDDNQDSNDVKNSSDNFIAYAELETETNDVHNQCSPVCYNSSSIVAESDKCNFLSLVKPCYVSLQKWDSNVNEYFTSLNHPASCEASLKVDALPNESNIKVNDGILEDPKLKTRKRKREKKEIANHRGTNDAETRKESLNIKKARRNEKHLNFTECDDSDMFMESKTTKIKCGVNVNEQDENVGEGTTELGLNVCEWEVETKKAVRKRSDCETSHRNSDNFEADNDINFLRIFKKKKTDEQLLHISNISDVTNEKNTLTEKYRGKVLKGNTQQLNKNDGSDIDNETDWKAMYHSTSKENFQSNETEDGTEILSTQTSICSKGTDEQLITDKEHKNTELPDASCVSSIDKVFQQPKMQLDYSLLSKACHVVLTRCDDYIDNKAMYVPCSPKISRNYNFHSDSSELSDIDYAGPRKNFVKKIDNTKSKYSAPWDQYEDSGNELFKSANRQKVKQQRSGLNKRRPKKLADCLVNTSDSDIHSFTNVPAGQIRKILTRQSKYKKYRSQARAYAPDSSTSRGSDNKELLEHSTNELIHELKELKQIMKRTERKVNLLIKLHKKVLDCYE